MWEIFVLTIKARMDLTAFGPYALNVRTDISSYGPRAQLIRAYCCLTKLSVRAKRSISHVFSMFIVPSPFFVHYPYKGRINQAKGVLAGLCSY